MNVIQGTIAGLFLFAFSSIALSAPAGRTDNILAEILTSRDVLISAEKREDCSPGRIFAIFSQSDSRKIEEKTAEPIGFAESYAHHGEKQCLCRVKSHTQSALIRAGDFVQAIDLTRKEHNLPGRNDLIREGHREFASFYKPLVYGGYLFGQTASTLDRREWLVGLSHIMYGLKNDLQIDATYLLLFYKVAMGGIKYRFVSNEDMRLAIYVQGARFLKTGQGAWAAEAHYDSISNSRVVTHTKLSFTSKVPTSVFLTDKEKEKDSSVELSTVTEWVLKSWNRLLLGPKFVAGDQFDLGFSFSFIYVSNSFHAAANLSANTVKRFDFKNNRQTVGLDLFWRF